MNAAKRFFRFLGESAEALLDAITFIAANDVEKFCDVAGLYTKDDDGELVEIEIGIANIGNQAVFEPSHYGIHENKTDLFDANGDPVDYANLDVHFEGYTYWDGSNWKWLVLTSDFDDAGFEEVTDNIAPIDLIESHAYAEIRGVDYWLRRADDGTYWLDSRSRWQGSYPFPVLYQIDLAAAEDVINGHTPFTELIAERTSFGEPATA